MICTHVVPWGPNDLNDLRRHFLGRDTCYKDLAQHGETAETEDPFIEDVGDLYRDLSDACVVPCT